MKRIIRFAVVSALTLAFLLPESAFAMPAKAFQGKPAFTIGKSLGAYVWKDKSGIHVRFTTKGKPHRFHGLILR